MCETMHHGSVYGEGSMHGRCGRRGRGGVAGDEENLKDSYDRLTTRAS